MNTDAQALKGLINFLVKGSIENKKKKTEKKEDKKVEKKEPDIIKSDILEDKESPKAIMMSLSALSAKSKKPIREENKEEEERLHNKKRINKKWYKK